MLTDSIAISTRGLFHKRIVREFMKLFFQCSDPEELKESFEKRYPEYEIFIKGKNVALRHRKHDKKRTESNVVAQTQAPE